MVLHKNGTLQFNSILKKGNKVRRESGFKQSIEENKTKKGDLEALEKELI